MANDDTQLSDSDFVLGFPLTDAMKKNRAISSDRETTPPPAPPPTEPPPAPRKRRGVPGTRPDEINRAWFGAEDNTQNLMDEIDATAKRVKVVETNGLPHANELHENVKWYSGPASFDLVLDNKIAPLKLGWCLLCPKGNVNRACVLIEGCGHAVMCVNCAVKHPLNCPKRECGEQITHTLVIRE